MTDQPRTMKRLVQITGRVQGVGFRAWTADEARRLNVAGWVRNEEDGSVSALLQGEAGAVETLCERMREGPPGASVEQLGTRPASENASPMTGFEIRRR